ncbi:MAG: SurA N-terminal domain-containing protein [Pseudomonadota bacterium]
MITSFRRFFQSKLGMAFFLAFLALVALAFAGADITGNTFGGVTQGERVALVGDEAITSSELTEIAQSSLQGVRRQNPAITMPAFIEQGGLDEVLSQIIDRAAISAYATESGLRAGENLVNSEILQIPAFRGVGGEFDPEVYRAALAQQRISDASLRSDLADGLLSQQSLLPALISPQVPEKVARQYTSLFLERRTGQIALIPSALFLTEEEPDQAAIEAYYGENNASYVEPERRKVRFALLNSDNLKADTTPTEAEIAARFEATKEQYAARESRDITSFTVPTEEGANALVEQIRAGKSLDVAAREAGFNTTQAVDRDQEQVSSTVSYAAAQAIFAAAEGEIADPAQTTLGYIIARVDKITNTPERTLAEVSEEISEVLTVEKRAAALADLTARVEEEVDQGTSLTEIADVFELTLTESPSLLADGRVYGDPTTQPNPALAPILSTAFALDESQPQLDVLVPGSQFLVYDVTQIDESAAPPLAIIQNRVIRDLQLSIASGAAKEAAERVLKKVREDIGIATALSEEEQPIPPADDVTLARQELQRLGARGPVPPALALMFSMARGTVKLLEAPRNQGWILVALNEISTDEIPDDTPIVQGLRAELAETVGDEYSEQLVRSMRESVGVERNDEAVATVRSQLAGES